MRTFSEVLENAVQTGAVASVATTAATAVCGSLQNHNAIAPLNAVSHILWGDRAALRNRASWKYTATGIALNTAAVTSWAFIYEGLFGRREPEKNPVRALTAGTTIAAIAYVTDYYMVPRRFTPGFEKRLSRRLLFGIYGVLAVSLAVGSMLRRSR